MNLPHLNNPQRYQGLYVYDFGDHVAVGYTAEEIEVLQASAEFGRGQAYKIHHATAEGQLALRGMSRLDTSVEEALVFYRSDAGQAREDFEQLKRKAMFRAPPCVVYWHLGSDAGAALPEFTILLYPAAYTELVSQWLSDLRYEGGDTVEGGAAAARSYRGSRAEPLGQVAIAPDPRLHSRPRDQVLASVHQPVQRAL